MKKKITVSYLKKLILEELINERVNTIAGDPFDMPDELRKAINESRLVNAGGGFDGYGELKSDYWERTGIKEPRVKDSGSIIIGINIASEAGYRSHINLPGALNAYPHLKGQAGNHLKITHRDEVDPAKSGNMVLLEDNVYNELKAWLDENMPMYKRAKKMADDAGETGFDGLGNAKAKIERGKEAFAKDYAASGAGRAEAMGLRESKKITTSYLKKLIQEEIEILQQEGFFGDMGKKLKSLGGKAMGAVKQGAKDVKTAGEAIKDFSKDVASAAVKIAGLEKSGYATMLKTAQAAGADQKFIKDFYRSVAFEKISNSMRVAEREISKAYDNTGLPKDPNAKHAIMGAVINYTVLNNHSVVMDKYSKPVRQDVFESKTKSYLEKLVIEEISKLAVKSFEE